MELEDLDDPHAGGAAPSRDSADAAVERYLMTPPATAVTDIMSYWRVTGQTQYPELKSVARFAHGCKQTMITSRSTLCFLPFDVL